MLKSPLLTAFQLVLFCVALMGCSENVSYEEGADKQGHTSATPATVRLNKQVLETLPFEDETDFENARRGFVAQDSSLIIQNEEGTKLWDMPEYSFIEYQKGGNAPGSANPSLWRQAALNNIHGLFKVSDGIYQLRGFDLANMTIIESDTGWIIVDPLTSQETATKALLFAQQHLGKQPIRAVLFTHSHIDHFGGVQGILSLLSEEEKQALRIIAPKGFIEEASSENIIAGTAMSRRAMFMYGKRLARTERGHLGSGLGKGPAFGTFSIGVPTELIDDQNLEKMIDGVSFVFQYVPGSEAPAEFTFYLPELKAFCGAELVSRNLHNLYTLRGAKVRDALRWSGYIEEAKSKFDGAEVYFGSHHWPLWGQSEIQIFLAKQRDVYKYIHDQSVRLMNAGFSPKEIAEQLVLPESLDQNFSTRGYYGTLKHNSKAIYQAYMGWYTGNPAMLDPLPEVESARRTIDLMGGANAALAKALTLFDAANQSAIEDVNKEYRWVAQLVNQIVFADPANSQAKALLAKTYDQLGYQAESAPWRDVYLSGAYELRHGVPEHGISPVTMRAVLLETPVEKFFDSMAVNLNGPDAEGKVLTVKVQFTDLNSTYLLSLENSVLRHSKVEESTSADATLILTHPLFVDILVGKAGLKDTLFGDDLSVEGSKLDLLAFFSLMDKPQGIFNIVTP